MEDGTTVLGALTAVGLSPPSAPGNGLVYAHPPVERLDGDFVTEVGARTVHLRCPFCGHLGTFNKSTPNALDVKSSDGFGLGVRTCPNPRCLGLVFVLWRTADYSVVESFPPELPEFERSGVPEEIQDSFEEALRCYAASCWRASAIMIRRTLEMICDDKGATGRNLMERIDNLRRVMTIQTVLIAGLHDLRLLGNDAGHPLLTDFPKIDREELDAAIAAVRMVLMTVYQQSVLVERLRALKARKEAEAIASAEPVAEDAADSDSGL